MAVRRTEDLAASLELIKDLDTLDHLFDFAVVCTAIDEFRAALS